VWKKTGIFDFGLIVQKVRAVILMLHWNRATQMLTDSTVLIIEMEMIDLIFDVKIWELRSVAGTRGQS
jgi:hypothetical protein